LGDVTIEAFFGSFRGVMVVQYSLFLVEVSWPFAFGRNAKMLITSQRNEEGENRTEEGVRSRSVVGKFMKR
jgi:hypothetical protein